MKYSELIIVLLNQLDNIIPKKKDNHFITTSLKVYNLNLFMKKLMVSKLKEMYQIISYTFLIINPKSKLGNNLNYQIVLLKIFLNTYYLKNKQ